MSPRRRIQTDVPDGGSDGCPETEDPDGCPLDDQTDVPETEDPDGCP